MIKKTILFFMVLLFVGCDIKMMNYDNDQFYNNKNKEATFDFCTNYSYILTDNSKEYGKLFVEYIDLDINCTWHGFQRGFFDDLFSSTLKLKSMKAVERLDYKNYEFSTYLINDKFYMNLIYKFGAKDDTFIVDYDGKLSDKLIKDFDENYINKYINKPRFSSNYSTSIVDKNIINSYFSKESESFNIIDK